MLGATLAGAGGCAERLVQIQPEILDVFETNREAEERGIGAFPRPAGAPLDERFDTAETCRRNPNPAGIDHGLRRWLTPGHQDRQHAAKSTAHLAFCHFVARVGG